VESTHPSTWPDVAVVMAVRNGAAYIAQAARSILEQSYPGSLEFIVAVGPSTDETEPIARALATKDARVTVIPNPEGTTPVGLNRAIASSDRRSSSPSPASSGQSTPIVSRA
jgi:succinoglycan biosynthesis protein ExoA